jgi:ArsR family transcriptional regulator, lead/cadmium/zinc/bismuth-responsive transcriptional repressor
MPSRPHAHPLDPAALKRAQVEVLPREEAEKLSELLKLLADQVRARLLFALVAVDELCVGDLSLTLADVTEDQVSYALKMLRTAGLVENRRDGRAIYYRLADGFPHLLLEHCLRQLLTIASGTGERS